MNCRRLVCRAVVALAVAGTIGQAAVSPATGTEDGRQLGDGVVIDDEIASGQVHRFNVQVGRGESVVVAVEQRSVDVVVRVLASDGLPVEESQDEVDRDSEEVLVLVGEVDCLRTVEVSPAPGSGSRGEYRIRIASRRPATGTDHLLERWQRLRTEAARLQALDKAEEAQPLVEDALRLITEARGAEDDQVGLTFAQLAAVYMDLAEFAKAEAEYRRAIAILERTRGPDSATTAVVRSRLATLYQQMGQRPQAEAALRQAMTIIERTLGTRHLWYARCLGTLSALRLDARDFAEAAGALRREASILEGVDYTDTILYAGVLNNLGEVYGRTKDFAQAERYLQRALALGTRLRGADDYFLSNPLVNLGIIARERRDYPRAEAYYVRALEIRRRLAGADSAELGPILNNLANVYHAIGDYRRSLDMHFEALRFGERVYGPYHHNTLLSVGNIARVSAAMGDFETAVAYQRRADAIIEVQLALNLSVGAERQKRLFVNSIGERTDRTVSLHLDLARDRPDAAALAAEVVLQRKGRVLDAMLDAFAVVRQRLPNPRDQRLLAELRDVTGGLAGLALRAAERMDRDRRQAASRRLELRKEQLESALGEHSAEFRAQLRPASLQSVQAAVPDGAALLEFVIFRPFDPAAERTADGYGPPRYAVYVIRHTGTPSGFDLGDAADLDDLIARFRMDLRDPHGTGVGQHARRLYDRLIRPLEAALAGAKRLLVSPDGGLNLIPFEALADDRGFVIEQYAITYLTSGRDLLRMRVKRSTGRPAVVFANPSFGEPDPSATPAVYFAPLPGSATEARAIKALFPRAEVLTGSRASRSAMLRVEAPRMLHIASHGFFLERNSLAMADDPPREPRTPLAEADGANPLLRSGVALAGANLARPDAGILTALEASALNLWGTKLVTLSACDTGLGEIRTGDGVYGLRRAFVLAGAESLVMSLWPVGDAVARQMMVAFYRGLRAGLGRGDALRQAALTMMARPGRRHPYYWASFIQSGEWANLDGRRAPPPLP